MLTRKKVFLMLAVAALTAVAGAFFAPAPAWPDAKTAVAVKAETPSLAAMSFNIRTLAPSDGFNHWVFRRDHVAALIRRHAPDVAGLQEVYPSQARDLERRLPDYQWYGVPRDDGQKRGEMCAIFYRPDRLEPIDQGTFWLSERPDQPGSRSWDSSLPRVATWIKFKDLDSGARFVFLNTHFDHIGQTARRESAKLLRQRLNAIADGLPVIAVGDFNSTPDSDPYLIITQQLLDARLVSLSPPTGPEPTTRDFNRASRPAKRIDYIFVTPGLAVGAFATIDDTYGRNRRPSDHMPVFAEIMMPRAE